MNYYLFDALWGTAVLTVLGIAIVVTKVLEKKLNLSGEATRKAIHISMGVAVLPFPWIIHYKLTVIIIGLIALVALTGLRLFGKKAVAFSSVLYNVDRGSSLGELVYPLAVMFTYLLAKSPVMYVIPILVLAFSDSLAALVGVNYGKIQLGGTKEDAKSFEGAVAFFFSSFVCVISPLLLLSDLSKPQILYVSVITAGVATLIELVSSFGLDNFLIPFTIIVFLNKLTGMSDAKLITHIILLAVFTLIAITAKRYLNITRLGITLIILTGFLTTLLGSYVWIAAPALLFFTYSIFPSLSQSEKELPLTNHIIETNVLLGLIIVVFGSLLNNSALVFWLYFTCFACLLTLNTYLRIYFHHPEMLKNAAIRSLLKSICLMLLPATGFFYLLYHRLPPISYAALSVAVIMLALVYEMQVLKKFHFPALSATHGWVNFLGITVLIFIESLVLILIG